jgi:hypothetical protein
MKMRASSKENNTKIINERIPEVDVENENDKT